MSRAKAYEIAGILRKSMSTEARLTIEMISILAEDARQTLVSADGDDMLRAQGVARVLDKLYRQLVSAPPTEDR